jgi:hypothetical protein
LEVQKKGRAEVNPRPGYQKPKPYTRPEFIGLKAPQKRLQFGKAISTYVEQSPDTAIERFFPILNLPLIQNFSQIFSSSFDGDLCSRTLLPKAPELSHIFLDGRLNRLS